MTDRSHSTEYTRSIPNLKALVAHCGGNASTAADLLGLSDLSLMLRENKARPAYEMAAAYLLKERTPPPAKDKLLLVRIPADDGGVSEEVLARLGITCTEISA